MALERIVGVLAAQFQALGQRHFEIGRVVERGPLDGVGVLVDRRTRRIDPLAVFSFSKINSPSSCSCTEKAGVILVDRYFSVW